MKGFIKCIINLSEGASPRSCLFSARLAAERLFFELAHSVTLRREIISRVDFIHRAACTGTAIHKPVRVLLDRAVVQKQYFGGKP